MGPSWGHLGPSWGRLGSHKGHLETISGPLGPSLSRRKADFSQTLRSIARLSGPFRVAGGTGRIPRGSSFGKEPKPNPKKFSTSGPPCHESTWGGGSNGLRPIRPLCAWVVGQRALESSLGSRGMSFGGLLKAVLRRLGGLFWASWRPLWASWGPFGFLGGLMGASWGSPGGSWAILGASWGRGLEMSVSVPLLGTPLEPSWGSLGPS